MNNSWMHIANLLLVFPVIKITNSYFYGLGLLHYSNRVLKKFGLRLKDLQYSFEDITYLINVPTQNPQLLQSARKNLFYKKEYSHFLFPRIKGIRFFLRSTGEGNIPIAYLPNEKYTVPVLHELLINGKLDRKTYRRIGSCKLVQSETLEEILDEVYQELRRENRFI